jgi:hypothetical protein
VSESLRERWLALTREELPARARTQGWPLRLDHCFQRVLLDQACGGRWYDHVAGRPAYRHLDPERLGAAVALGERLLREGEPLLRRLDEDSLRWRGKRPPARSTGGERLTSRRAP